MTKIRLLLDPPAVGTWNMAVDEALLETAATRGMATLRFYQWEEPTLSLGYFQAAADRDQHPASRDCPLVRRPSGGGAIVHDRELTYSIATPRRETRTTTARELYETFHETLIEALAEFGMAATVYRAPAEAHGRRNANPSAREPFLCFQRRSSGDIVCGDIKIVGSAQRRRRGAVLQHGSILLARSRCAPELPGIEELTGRCLGTTELLDRWRRRLLVRLSASFSIGELNLAEYQLASRYEVERFAAPDHGRRR